MLVHLLKAKIHRAAVTAASLDYEGSLTIDARVASAVAGLPELRRALKPLKGSLLKRTPPEFGATAATFT